MARYIDTDEFEKRIKPYDTDDRVDKAMYLFAHNMMLCTSTADVHERKVGKWKLNREGNWACPFCEFDPYHDEMNGMNYCPNCGARLEGFDNGKVH